MKTKKQQKKRDFELREIAEWIMERGAVVMALTHPKEVKALAEDYLRRLDSDRGR